VTIMASCNCFGQVVHSLHVISSSTWSKDDVLQTRITAGLLETVNLTALASLWMINSGMSIAYKLIN